MRTGPYTYGEEHAIAVLAPLGAHYLAIVLDRDVECVRRKASRLGVSVKKRPGGFDVREMSEAQLRIIVRLNPGLLCPSCGKRFINTPSGVCDLCHLRALTTNHDLEYRRLALDAKRDYDTAKQRLSRKRKDLGAKAPRAKDGDGE